MLLPNVFSENFLDGFFDDFARPVKKMFDASTSSVMKADVKEREDGYDLLIDLPGYKKDDVSVKFKDGYLIINANNQKEDEEKNEAGRYIRRERYYGSCSRGFYVGDAVKKEDIKAKFEDGMLKLDIPKKVKQPELEENQYIEIAG